MSEFLDALDDAGVDDKDTRLENTSQLLWNWLGPSASFQRSIDAIVHGCLDASRNHGVSDHVWTPAQHVWESVSNWFQDPRDPSTFSAGDRRYCYDLLCRLGGPKYLLRGSLDP